MKHHLLPFTHQQALITLGQVADVVPQQVDPLELVVPLSDGTYGFDLGAFLRYVELCKAKGKYSLAQIGCKAAGDWANRLAIPETLGDDHKAGLTYHSLRHSLASRMQVKGVPTVYSSGCYGARFGDHHV